jgi:hypothetical protein
LKRVKSIDGVTLDNNCFISTEFDIDDYIGERNIAIDGSSVVFVQAKGAMTREVKIYSKDSGWIHKDTKDLIIATVDTTAKTVVYSDDTSDTFYYDHSRVPVSFQPLYEGSLWYTIEINLLKG